MDIAEWADHVLTLAAERFERRLAEEIGGLRSELTREMHAGFTALRQEISDQRAELLKWSFGFWVSQFAATAGLLVYLLRAR